MNAGLASLSNQFVYAAMTTFTLAFISFAVSLAATRGTSTPARARGPGSRGRRGRRSTTHRSGGLAGRTLAPGRRSGNIAMALTWLSTGLLLIGVVLRGLSASRVPWGNMYEFSITAALAVAIVFLLASLRNDLRWLGVFITGLVLLTLGLAVTVLYTESAQLVPALKSWWLVIHVSAAVICAGGFTLSASLSSLYLVGGGPSVARTVVW